MLFPPGENQTSADGLTVTNPLSNRVTVIAFNEVCNITTGHVDLERNRISPKTKDKANKNRMPIRINMGVFKVEKAVIVVLSNRKSQ